MSEQEYEDYLNSIENLAEQNQEEICEERHYWC